MNEMTKQLIIQTVLQHYPHVQGIYLFGSYGSGNEWESSDIDLALLLPPLQAKNEGDLAFSPCCFDLEAVLRKEVDLLNMRQVSTVFQKEIISGMLIYTANQYAIDEFEMLTLSYYQKLNEERHEILEAFQKTGRAYVV